MVEPSESSPLVEFQQGLRSGESVRLRCRDWVGTVQAQLPQDVWPAMLEVQRAVKHGLYAAGFISYEAATGFCSDLVTGPASPVPLVWFGLFRNLEQVPPLRSQDDDGFDIGQWMPSISRSDYDQCFEQIKAYIAAGDTYQVNYTFRLRASFRGNAVALFSRIIHAQKVCYGACIDTGRHIICSASPELFFRLDDGVLTSRPMKGTAPRGLTCQQDQALRHELLASPKNRAENAMITDMVRNDLGRVARIGSVQTSDVFAIEKYPTVWQMTSTVTAQTTADFVEIIAALFPCASITGTPKVRAMQIIRELEPQPRGVYTGCIGYLAPTGKAQFSVAIRTAVIDRHLEQAEFGVGGGIVWDSHRDQEYAECLTKAAVLTTRRHDFELLETMLWEPGTGYFLLEDHLQRMRASAGYFDFVLNADDIANQLNQYAGQFPLESQKVRLRSDSCGRISIEHSPLGKTPSPFTLRLATEPVNPQDIHLYHKTTCRSVYESARRAKGECDDVILYNPQGQVTETCLANIVVEKDSRLCTPPIECGLLGGVFRQHLLDGGLIFEKILTAADLRQADRIFIVNSVRKWVPAVLL